MPVLLLLVGCQSRTIPMDAPTPPTTIDASVPDVQAGEADGTTAPEQTEAVDPISIGDAFAPELGNGGYDVQDYLIKIALDPARAFYVEAEVGIALVLTASHLESISFDFIGFNIEKVLLNGSLAEYQRTPSKLLILLPENMAAGDTLALSITYRGEATQIPSQYAPFESHLGLFFPADGESAYVLSEPDGARFWIPSNDHPRDKALFHFEIRVPEQYTAVANGRLIETRPSADGQHTFVWAHDYPMATYLALVAVGKYERIESMASNGVLLRDYVFPANMERWQREFDVTEEAMLWMETMLGPYPYAAYGHVDINAGGIALETQSMVLMSSFMIREEVMVHELAHQWLGDLVSLNSWGEMWRNEGFATYFQYLWIYRDDFDAFTVVMDDLQSDVEANEFLEPLDDLSKSNLFDYESYKKGAVVVHALRKEVGDAAFFNGLRIYLDRFAYSTASDEDFISVMEEAAGMDLRAFFEYWLSEGYTGG